VSAAASSPSSASKSIYDELAWRGLVYAASEGTEEFLRNEKATLYIGFDPTAASLHVGSLLQILALARMQRFGHTPIGLVGGGTGMIGDPSGKTVERQLLTPEKVAENLEGIREQLSRFLDFDAKSNAARVIDNGEWLRSIGMIDFLREVGKHFTVNYLVAKESVKRRMESEEGLSYTEFSYSLLQSYDFLVLHDRFGCNLQMGASDQWGNITAGFELIRKLRHKRAYGLVSPLVVSASGVKFGKTEAGTIWLDAKLTSPYRFYQFWLNTTDADAPTYLKYFTWLGRPEIEELMGRHGEAPGERLAQRTLARELTRMLHGETALGQAERSSQVLFGGEVEGLGAAEALEIFAEVPSSSLDPARLEGGLPLADLLAETGLAASKGEARRKIREGGIYLNNRRAADEKAQLGRADFLDGQVLVLRKGRKDYHLVRLQGV
jgi:tyrosyl-tRNA synthetase